MEVINHTTKDQGSCKVYYVENDIKHEAVVGSVHIEKLMDYFKRMKFKIYGFIRL